MTASETAMQLPLRRVRYASIATKFHSAAN
jgi:hypothetical protein